MESHGFETNASSGSHEFSHTMQSTYSLLTLKIDKANSTDNSQNTNFYLDNVTAKSDVLQIKEENNGFYAACADKSASCSRSNPFGLKHKGYNNVVNGTDYPYGY